MSNSLRTHGLYSPWNSPGQSTGVGSLSSLQGIFPTHWHCRWILYQLSHKGSPLSLWLLNFYLLFTYFQPPTLSCRVCPTYSNSVQFSSVQFSSVQFSLVAQSCPTLCSSMNHSTPGLPVHHHLPEFTQTHVHRVGDAIQPSHPWSSPSPPAPNPSIFVEIEMHFTHRLSI